MYEAGLLDTQAMAVVGALIMIGLLACAAGALPGVTAAVYLSGLFYGLLLCCYYFIMMMLAIDIAKRR